MLPWQRCVICGKTWPEGQSPPCQHSDKEWSDWKREQFLPRARAATPHQQENDHAMDEIYGH